MSAIVKITFGIRSDTLDPQAITDDLGLAPCNAFRKGDEYPTKDGRILVHSSGVWQVRSEGVIDPDGLERLVNDLLVRLEPVRDRLVPYLSDPSVDVLFGIWWETESETGGYCLSTTTMIRLASLCKVMNFTHILMRED